MSESDRFPGSTIIDAFHRSRQAVAEAQERFASARVSATRVREALRGAKSEHREMIARNLEEVTALHRAAASSSADRAEPFAGLISHELRQPLAAALAAAQLLQDLSGDPSPDHARALRVLRRQLLHMADLLDALLDMSRVSLKTVDLDLRRIAIREVIDRGLEGIEAAAIDSGITMLPPECQKDLWVLADEPRLQQIVGNLLSNAVRYTPRGGTIRLNAAADNQFVVVEIRDSGKGIGAAELVTIFEPFTRGADSGGDGLGIGLTLVRGLVELHGGTVGVSSEGPGKGSCFTIRLPRLEAANGSARTRTGT